MHPCTKAYRKADFLCILELQVCQELIFEQHFLDWKYHQLRHIVCVLLLWLGSSFTHV